MTRVLKTSGFLGLTVMMIVGLYQSFTLAGGAGLPGWMVSGHAHLGVLSTLAIVVGFAIPALGITGQLRKAVTGMFVVGQWGIPLTPWLAGGAGLGFLHPTAFLWGGLLVISMLIMTWKAAEVTESSLAGHGEVDPAPADD